MGRLKQRVDLNSLDRVDLFGAAPQVQCFGGQQEAQSFEVEMAEHAALTLLVGPKDFQRTSSKLGTYYVLGPGGALGTFQEFGRAAQVAEILDLVAHANISSWYVFWVQNPTLSEQMSKAWRAARLRWK